jgi:anthranilate phosphoribosyltransferase
MGSITTKEFGAVVTKLLNKENLNKDEAKEMFIEVMSDNQTDMHQGAFLAALNAKGETAEEIAGSWEAIYHLDTIKVSPEVQGPIVDNCGTGMDTFKTFNISTAASIIAAAGNVTIARHGARALSSVCGTVDIAEELGVFVESEPEIVKKSIEETGIGIFNGMSPKVHPAALGRILSQISFGTILNISASLANPALPKYGVRGVYSREMLELVPEIMKEIGYRKALVVFGEVDGAGSLGMDEASTLGMTHVAELKEDGSVEKYSFLPEDMGLLRGNEEEIKPLNDKQAEAERMVKLLMGKDNSSRTDIACLNTGLIFYLTGKTDSIRDGYEYALELVKSGKAIKKLQDWVRIQCDNSEKGYIKLMQIVNNVN